MSRHATGVLVKMALAEFVIRCPTTVYNFRYNDSNAVFTLPSYGLKLPIATGDDDKRRELRRPMTFAILLPSALGPLQPLGSFPAENPRRDARVVPSYDGDVEPSNDAARPRVLRISSRLANKSQQ